MVVNSILTCVLNAILFIPANKKCWIPQVELINFVKNTACSRIDRILNYLFLKNALTGRFFMSIVFYIFSSFSHATSNETPQCVSTHFDEKAYIKYVIDGDTVVLTDNRHIRLIGINTPEIRHDNIYLSEQGALRAKEILEKLLPDKAQIQLLYGKERFDKHGRTLAHIYLESNLNIQAEMLAKGLAMPLRIPPNLSLAECYDRISKSAKEKKLGLWAIQRFQTKRVTSLSTSDKGFYFISGKVLNVNESHSSIWINLENNVALRIHKDDLNYFNKNDLMSLRGKIVEASGWLYKSNKQLRMRIRHKLDLNIIN